MPQVTVPTMMQDTARASRFAATGGTQTAVVKDGLDTTYIRRSSVGSPGAYFHLAIPTIPANNDVATVVPCARIKQPTGTAPKVLAMLLYGYTIIPAKPATKTAKAVPATTSYPAGPRVAFPGIFAAPANVAADASNGAPLSPNGTAWLAALAAGAIGIAVDDGHAPTDANRDSVYELTASAYYAARPAASVAVDASTPLNACSFPLFDVTVSALIEAWQDNVGSVTGTDCTFDLHIFTAAQVAAGGFDPAVTTPIWSASGAAPLPYVDGVTLSTSTPSAACDTVLANGSYYAYVRAIRSFTAAVFGAWSSLAFTVAVAPPTSPTITAAIDDLGQCAAVTVTPQASAGATNPLITVQRTSDSGMTWQTIRGAASVPGTFGTPSAFYDYTAPRGVTLSYRASVVATVSAQRLSSAWTAATPIFLRTNYLTNSYGAANAGGKWTGFEVWNFNTATSPVWSIAEGVYGHTAQREQYTGVAADVSKSTAFVSPAATGFAAGDTAVGSCFIKQAASAGCSVNIEVHAYAGAAWLGYATATCIPTGTGFERYSCKYANLPATTDRVAVGVTVMGIDAGDALDISIDAAQLESAAFATPYIPTTTAAVTRNAGAPAVPVTGWNIKVPDVASMNMLGALILKDPEFQQVEETVEYNVPGRTYPVVVSMAMNGIDGAFDIQTRTDADWTLLQGVMAWRGPIYLESPFGWGRWVRIMPIQGGGRSPARKWHELGAPGDARRTVHLEYREVGES